MTDASHGRRMCVFVLALPFRQRTRLPSFVSCSQFWTTTVMLTKPKTAEGRPNIVYLMADDQSTYASGCYCNPDVQTPNLDRLTQSTLPF